MKLSVELLVDALEERLDIRDRRIQPCPALGRPLLYRKALAVETGKLYISEISSKALCRNGICTIYLGNARPVQPGGCSLCVNAEPFSLFNVLQEIFDLYDEWESRLEQVLLHHGSLNDLLSEARSLLVNPLIVMRTNFSLIAQDGENELPEDQRLFSTKYRAIELRNALNQDALYRRMLGQRDPYLYPAHILGWNSLNINIFMEDGLAFRLVLAEHSRKLRPGDYWLLATLATYVQFLMKLEQPDYQSDSRMRNLFLRVLSDRAADYLDISRQLSQLSWSAADSYFCLVLRTPEPSFNGPSANQIHEHLKREYPASCSCNFNDCIVTYFNVTKLGKGLTEISDELKYFIRECILKAGYSRVMQGHDNLRRLYLQAWASIEVGSRIYPDFWIHHFNSISLNFLLEESMHRLPANMICHEKLLALHAHDQSQGTDYMHTLRVYLDTNLNAVQSARQLFIHRSTLLYRLDKIKEILESALNDPEELLYLSLSFRLFENKPG